MSTAAYVDSSCLVAIALGEPSARRTAARLSTFTSILSNVLLDAEVRSACSREKVALPEAELALIEFVPLRRLISAEIDRVLAAGYLRGAECLHLATALVLSPDPRQLTFLTLDAKQRVVAKTIGFRV